MIAAIPLIFGLQQCAEGVVWLSFIYPTFESIRLLFSYIFLACAGVFWPLWIPLAVGLSEGRRRYRYYVPSVIAGLLFACIFSICVSMYPLRITAPCNIMYTLDFSQTAYGAWGVYLNIFSSLLYIIATIIPFFIARTSKLWIIGGLIAGSYIVSYIAYYEAFTSVWCFFAAIISLLVYWFVCT
jgi:hypothetical protein